MQDNHTPPQSLTEFLTRPARLNESLWPMVARYRKLEAACTRITPGYSDAPGGKSSGSGDTQLAALADTSRELDQARQDLYDAMTDIFRFCDVLKSREIPNADRNIRLLLLRYPEGLSWEAVRRELTDQGFPCSRKTLYNWQSEALTDAEKLWEETHHE